MQRGYQIFNTYHFIMSNIKYSYDKDNMSYFAKQVPNPKKILNMDAVIPFSTLATFTNNMYNISEDSIKNDSKKELSIKHTIDVINTSINKYDGSILKAQLLDKTIDNQSFDLYIDFSVKRRLDNDQTSGSNKKLKIENNEHTLRRSDQDEHEEHEQDKLDKKENDILAKNIKEQDKLDKKDAAILAKKIKEQDKLDKKDAAILAKKIKEQDKLDKIQQKEDAKQAKILEREIAKQDKLDKIQQKQEEKRLKEKEKQDKKDAALLAKQIKEKEKQDKKDAAILANISKLQAKILS